MIAKRSRRDTKGKTLHTVLRFFGIVVSVGLIVYSAYSLFNIYSEYSKAKNSYDSIADEYTHSSDGQETTNTAGSGTVTLPSVNWAKLQKKNPDVIAWIYSPNTQINYPVTVGRDNVYYLTHLFDGSKNASGSIFIDQSNSSDFSDDNTVFHGHHMKNGGMFASIEKYKKQSYFEEHPTVYLLTPETNYRVELFAGTVRDDSLLECTYADGKAQQAFIKKAIKDSTFKSPIEVSETDRIVTLSTCDYSREDARYTLFGKLVKE